MLNCNRQEAEQTLAQHSADYEDVDDTETTEEEFDHAMASAFPANVYTSPFGDKMKAHLHDTMDARVWAAEFVRIVKEDNPADLLVRDASGREGALLDEGWLIGWFANAIMAGYDAARREDPATARIRVADLVEPDCSPLPKAPERTPKRRNAVKPVTIPRSETPNQAPNN